MQRLALGIIMIIFFTDSFAQQPPETPSGKIHERGRYLAENVAMCIQCHTPREATGDLIKAQAFQGASIPVGRPSQAGSWAEYAPRIAGLPQYTDEQMVRLLMTGIGREGKSLRSPMPTFKMNRQDAEDVVSYLKSVQ